MKNNPDKVKLHRKNARENSPIHYRIRKTLKSRIRKLFKAKKYNDIIYLEKVRDGIYILPASEMLLGMHPIKFLEYIESKLLPGMTWDNYGCGGNKWEIDHIKCISSFDLTNKTDLMAINHYTNLLPMWSKDNNLKSGKAELDPILDKYLLDKYKELVVLVKK
jgi:hypothetical protein